MLNFIKPFISTLPSKTSSYPQRPFPCFRHTPAAAFSPPGKALRSVALPDRDNDWLFCNADACTDRQSSFPEAASLPFCRYPPTEAVHHSLQLIRRSRYIPVSNRHYIDPGLVIFSRTHFSQHIASHRSAKYDQHFSRIVILFRLIIGSMKSVLFNGKGFFGVYFVGFFILCTAFFKNDLQNFSGSIFFSLSRSSMPPV